MEFRVRHFGGPLVYSSPGQLGPYEGLPLEVVAQIGADGLGGIQYEFDHFMKWDGPIAEGALGGWTLVNNTGTATIVQLNTRIGEITLSPGTTDNAEATLQLTGGAAGMNFIYAVGKRMWMAARIKFVTVALTELFLGMGTLDNAPCVTSTLPSDWLFFHKTKTGTKINFDARKDGTSTSKTVIGTTLVDDTYTILAFYVDPTGNIHIYQDGTELTASMIAAGTANIPGAADVMAFMVGIQEATDDNMNLTLDWAMVAQER